MWSKKVDPGYLSPPIATPSNTPSVFIDIMLLSSLDIPPDRDTYATLKRDKYYIKWRTILCCILTCVTLSRVEQNTKLCTCQVCTAWRTKYYLTCHLCYQSWSSLVLFLQPKITPQNCPIYLILQTTHPWNYNLRQVIHIRPISMSINLPWPGQ